MTLLGWYTLALLSLTELLYLGMDETVSQHKVLIVALYTPAIFYVALTVWKRG